MKHYSIYMTYGGGTAIAGNYIAETKWKAFAMAKKDHGAEWSFYVNSERNVDMSPRNFLIGCYSNDDENTIGARWGPNEIRYGTEADAFNVLKCAKESKENGSRNWQIFWINTDRDNWQKQYD